MKVIKRNGSEVEFDLSKIVNHKQDDGFASCTRTPCTESLAK